MNLLLTRGIANKGFSGMRSVVARNPLLSIPQKVSVHWR
jgi:hypothetical protein